MKASNTEQAQILEICLKHIKHELLPDSLTKYAKASERESDTDQLYRGYFDLSYLNLKVPLNDTTVTANNDTLTVTNERLNIKYSFDFHNVPMLLYRLQRVNLKVQSRSVLSFSESLQAEYIRQQKMDKKELKKEIKKLKAKEIPYYDSGSLRIKLPLYVYETYINN